jgi:hypothetical protein
MMDCEPVYQPARGVSQDSIIVEARSLSGYSGSPVFVAVTAGFGPPEPDDDPATRSDLWLHTLYRAPFFLLGINWGHHPWEDRLRDGETKEPTPDGAFVRSNSGMMMVAPAWKITEILYSDELVTMREQLETIAAQQVNDNLPGVVVELAVETAKTDPISVAPFDVETVLRGLLGTQPEKD